MNEKKKKDWIHYFYQAHPFFRMAIDRAAQNFNKKLKPKYRVKPEIYLLTQEIPDYFIDMLVLIEKSKMNKAS